MSGDVQPRKRKDKKRKKDELGTIEEPRGTAATLGEGDVFMHSYHDHGTGGNWCAKIIFFSLLAVLVTLIGLIILENRGLSELEANSVESRYSGVLDGWLEDMPDDDHHDEHTLELNHHDDDDHSFDHHDEDDEADDDQDGDEDEDDHDNSQADDEDTAEGEDDRANYRIYYRDDDDNDEEDDEVVKGNSYYRNDDDDADVDNGAERVKRSFFDQDGDDDDDGEDDDEKERSNVYNQDSDSFDDANGEDDDANGENNDANGEIDDCEDDDANDDDEDDNDERVKRSLYDQDDDDFDENYKRDENYRDEQQSEEDENNFENNNDDHEDDDEHDDHDDDDDEHDNEEIEVEHIEQEPDDQEPISLELPALPEDDDDDDGQDDENDAENAQDDDKSDEFLDPEDDELPVVERITAPAGKPFVEVDDIDASTELPPDTLEEEEEYEKKQEELRKAEEEESTNMCLKLSIGAALLLATHAVMRRATTSRDDDAEEDISREETPISDRRMTLIPEEVETVTPKKVQEVSKPFENIVKKSALEVKASPKPPIEEDEEIEEIEVEEENEDALEKDKELYSDEEVEEEEEYIPVIQQNFKPKPVIEQKLKPITVVREPSPEPEDEDDDVEIIDEQIEEEVEEDEEISDVDDAELLTRLEEKYGRLPDPDRPTPKHKDGGNSVDDDWPGEPTQAYWQQQLDEAEKQLRQGSWSGVISRVQQEGLKDSARARWLIARALDAGAEAQRDNQMLSRAIAAYLNLIKIHDSLPDNKLKLVAERTLDRMKFRGNYLGTEPVYRLMIRRFPEDVSYRNNLTIAFLMAGKNDMAEEVLKETLKLWPNDAVALAHYAFVLKNQHNRPEEAVELFQKALKGDKGPACEPRFYYHLGDALLLLGRFAEAHEVHKRGAKLGHFLSPAQRSLYNVKRLKGQPWWNVDETPYVRLARALEKSWKDILKEGLAAHALYEQEKEGLKDRGEWSQLDLFARGYEIPDRCKKAPITCSIVKTEAAAVGCKRGQIKFSAMEAGTHVRPHVGPTNCRLRMHLALSNTKDTYLRVDQETRQWHEGNVLMFDDSFEHEVWHNGTGKRLVLIVDVWHPELTPVERRQLSPI